MKLVLAGQKRWWTEKMQNTFSSMQFKNDIIFTGRVEDNDMTMLMGSALALTYVSTFEGFGIPILEAMRCNVPVITSNVTSMPEIAGNAAIFCDPFSESSIADTMDKIFTNEELRKSLIERGRIRRNNFSWQQSADGLWQSIERILPGR